MPLKTPDFWYSNKRQIWAKLLAPISFLYASISKLIYALKVKKPALRARCPVICIGGIVAGGSGKTPTAIAIRNLLGYGTFLTRGYGGRIKSPTIVDTSKHGAKDLGDEALLLARCAKTIVAKNRALGAQTLGTQEKLLIMDDGFQNPNLYKDLSLIVIDGQAGIGNGHTIPSGPLREKPKDAFARCSGVIIIGKDKHNVSSIIPPSIPIFRANLKISIPKTNKPLAAFAGLGRPWKFKFSLINAGANLSSFTAFPDHHPYTQNDIAKLRTLGGQLITTEKDAARLSKDMLSDILIAKCALEFDSPDKFAHFLTSAPQKR